MGAVLGMITTTEMRRPRPEGLIPRIQIRSAEIEPHIQSIFLKGRLDILGVEKIEMQFAQMTIGEHKSVIVDLSEVELMSSVGLGMLIKSANTLKGEGKAMVLQDPQPRVERVIRIACLDQLLPIEFSFKRAVKRIKANENQTWICHPRNWLFEL